jgi:uncharacterized membrane protein YhaH (DUF805 family)
MHWYLDVLKRYVDFSGRTGRKEFWMFTLINFVVAVGVFAADRLILGEDTLPYLYCLYGVAVLLPVLSVTVRRLHDIDFSAWWYLIVFIPLVGGIVLLILLVKKGTPIENRYGSVPATPSSSDMIIRP